MKTRPKGFVYDGEEIPPAALSVMWSPLGPPKRNEYLVTSSQMLALDHRRHGQSPYYYNVMLGLALWLGVRLSSALRGSFMGVIAT